MEKAFIVTKESEYYQDLDEYIDMSKQQNKFIKKFFKEKGIEANEYIVGGDGSVNQPFYECDKCDIRLRIVPIASDTVNFGKMLCKTDEHGLCAFKKSSKISKEFAQRCVDEKIIINLHSPRVADCFESIGWMHGCSYSQFEYNDKLYLKVSSKYLKEDDIPKGFVEIKLSEFYKAKEEYESENK